MRCQEIAIVTGITAIFGLAAYEATVNGEERKAAPVERVHVPSVAAGQVKAAQIKTVQKESGILVISVVDQLGGLITGANVVLRSEAGKEKHFRTNASGIAEMGSLAPGPYHVRISAKGFLTQERTEILVTAGERSVLSIRLEIGLEEQKVEVDSDESSGNDPSSVGGNRVLSEKEIESLPDDAEGFELALRQIAGQSIAGGELPITVNGFPGGEIPPKSAIRAIRIEQSSYSAQYDSPGGAGIQIFTKSGGNKFHGEGGFSFRDESLNARNAFALERAPYQRRSGSLSLSGPLVPQHASFFFSGYAGSVDGNAIVNAITLDPSLLQPVQIGETLVVPYRYQSGTLRIDYDINEKHKLYANYFYRNERQDLQGVGGFNLESAGYRGATSSSTLQLSETATLNQNTVTETLFQLQTDRQDQRGVENGIGVVVQDAFTGGGAQVDASSERSNFYLMNNTTWQHGSRTWKFGGRFRGATIDSRSRNNFSGTYTFTGGTGPVLDDTNNPVRDAGGNIVTTELSSIERYRRTLLFQGLGFDAAQIRELGGGASQFLIAGGIPDVGVRQYDTSLYLQQDWNVRKGLSLGLGIRYENQTNIDSPFNFAPRFGVAWVPGFLNRSGKDQKNPLVIRAGGGIYYARVGEDLTLEATRFNGINQQRYVIDDQSILNTFPLAPSTQQLGSFAVPQTTRILASDLTTPYTIQSGLSVTKKLPYGISFGLDYGNSRTLHALRTRNINAPLAGSFDPLQADSGVRPLGAAAGNIYQYESSGVVNSNLLSLTFQGTLTKRFEYSVFYTLRKSSDNIATGTGSPFDPYDYSNEYAPSDLDARHSLNSFLIYNAPFGFYISSVLSVASGVPFNLTTGTDSNGDNFFIERPAFATDPSKPGIVETPFGLVDPNPESGAQIIPRNLGRGPWGTTLVVSLNKIFNIGDAAKGERSYKVIFTVLAENVLNHTNLGLPVGNLSSPFFLSSNTYQSRGLLYGGARTIDVWLRFRF